MNAEEGGELIAQFIDCSYPKDKKKVFSILKLALNRAWKEGRWFGMTAEIFVKINKDKHGDNFIVSPRGYGSLLAIAVDYKPVSIRDIHFQFHRNGNGRIEDHHHCSWNTDVYTTNESCLMIDFDHEFPDGAIIGVRSLTQPRKEETINIQGKAEESPLFTFKRDTTEKCECIQIDSKKIKTIYGAEIAIDSEMTYIGNVTFNTVENIHKSHTSGIIEVIAFDKKTGKGKLISRMMPWEKHSKYKRYKIPSTCNKSIHGLFKTSPQPDIIDGSQPLIIDEPEAIISLAKGVHFMYHKDDLNQGQAFINQGINALEKNTREQESPDVFPIQVIGEDGSDIPEIFKQY